MPVIVIDVQGDFSCTISASVVDLADGSDSFFLALIGLCIELPITQLARNLLHSDKACPQIPPKNRFPPN